MREEEFGWPGEGGAESAWKGQRVKSEAQMSAGSIPGRQGMGEGIHRREEWEQRHGGVKYGATFW